MVVGIKIICENPEILQCSFCFFTIETGYRHAGVSQDEIAGLRVDILYTDRFMYTAEIPFIPLTIPFYGKELMEQVS